MSVPFWGDDPDAWDKIYINDWLFDETEVEVDFDCGNDFDVKKAPGADGAPSTNKGYDPAKPKVTVLLYKPEHFEQYRGLLADVQPKPGKKAPAIVSVVHPELQLVGKVKFKITKIHSLKKVGPQMKRMQIDLLEYFPDPKPIPKSSTNAKDGNRDPNDVGPDRILVRAREELPSARISPDDDDGGVGKGFGEG